MAYVVFNDPGHGWVRVKRAEVVELGIADKVSSYSYQKGDWVYLEEDCDFSLWLAAKKAKGHPILLKEKHSNRHSSIRNYDCYRPQQGA